MMRIGFSQRMGKKPVNKELQFESMDEDLKTGLWNVYLSLFLKQISGYTNGSQSDLDRYFEYIWREYFKYPLDQRNPDYEANLAIIKQKYISYSWHEVYHFIEFHVNWDYRVFNFYNVFRFIEGCNEVLEKEFSGYRIIEKIIVPISNQPEIDEINKAINAGNSFFRSKYPGVNVHLQDALSKLSDKTNPDYRNSIKESVSAVEAICRILTNENTLGTALNKMESKGIIINSQIKAGIDKLYAYTNAKGAGIRHALIEDSQIPGFEEAQFMLVVCSAFINLLISKQKGK